MRNTYSKIETCTNCKATSDPKPARKVSLSTLNRSFNDKICIDHMFLGDNAVIHMMDSTVRYSVGMIVPDTSMQHAICALESQWISQFWMPGGVIFDQAFDNSMFRSYLNKCDIEPIALPPRRHNKNFLESKHKILRDIYIRLKHCNDIGNFVTEDIIIQQTFRISNDLYGNDVMSSHEIAKGYSRPVMSGGPPLSVPDELYRAHETLIAKRKLNLILRSKPSMSTPIKVGDMVEVFIKLQKEKRGK